MNEWLWYLTRSTGIVAAVLMLAALAWGFLFSARETGMRLRPAWWLDLHNGLGGLAELASVTIVGPDLAYADAYATSVFVMGLDGLNWLAERHPDYAGFVITHDGPAISTPNFATHRLS